MSRKLTTSAVDAGQELGAWLSERLTLALEAAQALVAGGSVFVDGSRERDPATTLHGGEKIIVHTPAAAPATPLAWRIAFQDAEVLVIDKPAGLAVQATREAAGALDEQVAKAFPEARLLHRIDRDTSGLVLFTRSRTARQRMQAALETGAIRREYLAVVDGRPAEDSFTVAAPVGGRDASTLVHVLKRGRDASLVECILATGRTHQIRLHLAGVGHAILGDPLHAPPPVTARSARLALHATRLAWPGASAQSPLPAELAALVR